MKKYYCILQMLERQEEHLVTVLCKNTKDIYNQTKHILRFVRLEYKGAASTERIRFAICDVESAIQAKTLHSIGIKSTPFPKFGWLSKVKKWIDKQDYMTNYTKNSFGFSSRRVIGAGRSVTRRFRSSNRARCSSFFR